MDTLEGKLQALVTGALCEQRGCTERAEWYISRADESYHLCALHAIVCMEEREFWKQRSAIALFIPQ